MRHLLRTASFAVLLAWPLGSGPVSAAQVGDCRHSALETLSASAPDGFAIFQQIKDKAFFSNWISCDDAQLGLPTAVHESVHFITAETDAFPLVHGGAIARPHDVSGFFPPSLIARAFKPSDFVSTYLRAGRASSSSDFLYLLDELNAYTHDLNAAVDLSGLHAADEEVDHRDGLAALMAFVALYVETAADSQPETWRGLQEPSVAKTVAALWGRAETVMASSCGIPHFGSEDRVFIRRFCQADAQASLRTIIGQAPVCPTDCLTPTQASEAVSDDADAVPAIMLTPSAGKHRVARLSNLVTYRNAPTH